MKRPLGIGDVLVSIVVLVLLACMAGGALVGHVQSRRDLASRDERVRCLEDALARPCENLAYGCYEDTDGSWKTSWWPRQVATNATVGAFDPSAGRLPCKFGDVSPTTQPYPDGTPAEYVCDHSGRYVRQPKAESGRGSL